MSTRLVVFDFDGTLTDIAAEGAAFEAAYAERLLALIGTRHAADWARACADVREAAPELAWDMGTGPAAPADADPYIVATMALRRLPPALLPEPAEKLGGALYAEAYGAVAPAFRPDAAEVLAAAQARVEHVRVVTNASTAKAARKLAHLGLPRPLAVVGDAQKFVLAAPTASGFGIEDVPDAWPVPGLARPVRPRRGRYFDALAGVWGETGTTPAETLVVGDIWELDLALPSLLGASVHLLERERTHAYERAGIAAAGARGRSGRALADVLARF
jgi:FMN phosphatase YigB (HAD superfamily)